MQQKRTKNRSSKASRGWLRNFNPYLLSIALVGLIGIGVAIELTRVYVLTNVDPNFESFCSINQGVNCETVALSSYATSLGVINSVWAIFAYLWLMGIAVWGMVQRSHQSWPQGLIMAIATALVVVGGILFYIMKFVIGSLCVLCLGLDVVNVVIFILALALWRTSSKNKGIVPLVLDDVRWLLRQPASLLGVVLVTALLLVASFRYSSQVQKKIAAAKPVANSEKENGSILIGPNSYIPAGALGQPHQCTGQDCECQHGAQQQPTVQMGRDEHGHQWLGAAQPQLVVEEFTDYECPHCRSAHLRVRAVMARNPTVLRVVHRNYPLDHACNPSIKKPFHKRACLLARVAYCAGEQGRFWEMNDYLFQHAPTIQRNQMTAQQLAEQLELDSDRFQCCMDSDAAAQHLQKDIAAGRKLAIRGTPAFVVDGQVHYGSLPKAVLAELKAE